MKIGKNIIFVATNHKYTLINMLSSEALHLGNITCFRIQVFFSAFNFTEGMFPLTQHSLLNPSKTPTAETARLASQRDEVLTESASLELRNIIFRRLFVVLLQIKM